MRGLEPGDDWTALLAGFMLAGGGIGLVNPALATAAVGVVEPQRAGMASGINSTFRQVGIATGIAGLGAIFQHLVAESFMAGAGHLPPGVRRAARSPTSSPSAAPAGSAIRRSRARPSRRSSTASTTSCSTPGCSPSWARCSPRC